MLDDQIIASGQVITPEKVMNRSFTSAFRGYHPAEVREFLKRVGDEMAASAAREVELRRALQEALARVAHPELDEATVTNVLGEHAARLIASARQTAASITAEAQKQADAILGDAEAQVARMRQEADGLMARRVAEADASADSIRHAAEAEAEAQLERAATDARTLVEDARRQGKDMVDEARAVRERMLGDLARRRRSAQLQVEQLRAARDRLLAAYDVVRRTLEEATTELEAAEPEAREAAEAVARRSGEAGAVRPEPRAELWSPPVPAAEPERPRALVTAAATPAAALLRRPQPPSSPAPPEPPRLRPQTVAGAVAGRVRERPPDPEPVSDLGTGEVPAVTAHPPPAPVDELFARIRAGADDVESPPPAPQEQEEEPPPVDPIVAENALEQRDDLLDGVGAGLTRALKRVLQDEQNEVLDALRRAGASSATAVLPVPDAQLGRYRDAALPWLEQAARAGVGFVSDAEGDHPPVHAQASALARDLVEPLRERLTRGLDAEERSVAAESIRATYRQWKVQQVEASARHHALAAFSAGAFAAMPEAVYLQWLVDDDGHCPDCDDNSLAGPTPRGQPFPTGQLHPPAHPGCRCLLVPVTT
ncbi:MAG TPA: DivIVA domain-containing protein [Acidimicrobiales bacterium]|nr:DivIVA domain-containing protein [Acidimicrobiales bacterium]